MKLLGCIIRYLLVPAAVAWGILRYCRDSVEVERAPVSFRSDFVPLKVVMTDYVIADGGSKLFKIEGSAQLIVPLAGCEPELVGKCFKYRDLPRPVVDALSVKIDNQVLFRNDRGLFTSRQADSQRINELRAKAAEEMRALAGSETHVQQAMRVTADALRQFYEKFDGYSCSLQWK